MSNGKIAYTSNSMLHVLDLDEHTITRVDDSGRTAFPDWHPSGQQIASGLSIVTVYDFPSHSLTRTSKTDVVANYPAWHPSGKMLAFDVKQANEDGFYVQEFEHNVEFSIPLPFPAFQVDWHPNGREIVFVGNLKGTKHIFKLDMSCVEAGDCDKQVVQLTKEGKYNHAPAWSPDGSQIAFERYLDAEQRWVIMVMDADGGNLRVLSDRDGNDHHPTWGPEGWIAFDRQTPKGHRLFAVHVDGTGLAQLTETDSFEPDWWYPR